MNCESVVIGCEQVVACLPNQIVKLYDMIRDNEKRLKRLCLKRHVIRLVYFDVDCVLNVATTIKSNDGAHFTKCRKIVMVEKWLNGLIPIMMMGRII